MMTMLTFVEFEIRIGAGIRLSFVELLAGLSTYSFRTSLHRIPISCNWRILYSPSLGFYRVYGFKAFRVSSVATTAEVDARVPGNGNVKGRVLTKKSAHRTVAWQG